MYMTYKTIVQRLVKDKILNVVEAEAGEGHFAHFHDITTAEDIVLHKMDGYYLTDHYDVDVFNYSDDSEYTVQVIAMVQYNGHILVSTKW